MIKLFDEALAKLDNGPSKPLHFIIVNLIIVKNTCVSLNNPFADIRIWRDETIGQLIITIIASFIVVLMIFDNLLIP